MRHPSLRNHAALIPRLVDVVQLPRALVVVINPTQSEVRTHLAEKVLQEAQQHEHEDHEQDHRQRLVVPRGRVVLGGVVVRVQKGEVQVHRQHRQRQRLETVHDVACQVRRHVGLQHDVDAQVQHDPPHGHVRLQLAGVGKDDNVDEHGLAQHHNGFPEPVARAVARDHEQEEAVRFLRTQTLAQEAVRNDGAHGNAQAVDHSEDNSGGTVAPVLGAGALHAVVLLQVAVRGCGDCPCVRVDGRLLDGNAPQHLRALVHERNVEHVQQHNDGGDDAAAARPHGTLLEQTAALYDVDVADDVHVHGVVRATRVVESGDGVAVLQQPLALLVLHGRGATVDEAEDSLVHDGKHWDQRRQRHVKGELVQAVVVCRARHGGKARVRRGHCLGRLVRTRQQLRELVAEVAHLRRQLHVVEHQLRNHKDHVAALAVDGVADNHQAQDEEHERDGKQDERRLRLAGALDAHVARHAVVLDACAAQHPSVSLAAFARLRLALAEQLLGVALVERQRHVVRTPVVALGDQHSRVAADSVRGAYRAHCLQRQLHEGTVAPAWARGERRWRRVLHQLHGERRLPLTARDETVLREELGDDEHARRREVVHPGLVVRREDLVGPVRCGRAGVQRLLHGQRHGHEVRLRQVVRANVNDTHLGRGRHDDAVVAVGFQRQARHHEAHGVRLAGNDINALVPRPPAHRLRVLYGVAAGGWRHQRQVAQNHEPARHVLLRLRVWCERRAVPQAEAAVIVRRVYLRARNTHAEREVACAEVAGERVRAVELLATVVHNVKDLRWQREVRAVRVRHRDGVVRRGDAKRRSRHVEGKTVGEGEAIERRVHMGVSGVHGAQERRVRHVAHHAVRGYVHGAAEHRWTSQVREQVHHSTPCGWRFEEACARHRDALGKVEHTLLGGNVHDRRRCLAPQREQVVRHTVAAVERHLDGKAIALRHGLGHGRRVGRVRRQRRVAGGGAVIGQQLTHDKGAVGGVARNGHVVLGTCAQREATVPDVADELLEALAVHRDEAGAE
eukprot:PhM_4_TR18074/c1_g1_i2/m.44505